MSKVCCASQCLISLLRIRGIDPVRALRLARYSSPSRAERDAWTRAYLLGLVQQGKSKPGYRLLDGTRVCYKAFYRALGISPKTLAKSLGDARDVIDGKPVTHSFSLISSPPLDRPSIEGEQVATWLRSYFLNYATILHRDDDTQTSTWLGHLVENAHVHDLYRDFKEAKPEHAPFDIIPFCKLGIIISL